MSRKVGVSPLEVRGAGSTWRRRCCTETSPQTSAVHLSCDYFLTNNVIIQRDTGQVESSQSPETLRLEGRRSGNHKVMESDVGGGATAQLAGGGEATGRTGGAAVPSRPTGLRALVPGC